MAKDRNAWLDKVFRRSHSDNSRKAGEMALRAFDKVFEQSVEQYVSKLERGELDPYSLLDRFSAELDKKGLSPHTISDYLTRIRQYFAYNGIALDEGVFRAKVTMPRVVGPDDRAPTIEELRKILSWGKLRTKALILLLASSGMRIGESIRLKVRDIDLSYKPVKVKLSPIVASKTGEGRVTYMTDEAAEYLKKYLGQRIGDVNAWVFTSEADQHKHMSDDRAWKTIIDCIEKAGIGKDEESTIHGRRKIHPHSLRKFFFSRVVGVIGETAAHALMGHGTYLKTYYKRSEEERAKDYLKCATYLNVLGESQDVRRVKDEAKLEAIRVFAEALGVEPMRVRIEKQKQLGREPNVDEEIQAIQNEIKKLRSNPNNDPKMIVGEGELEHCIDDGWDVQTVLPSGKILIKKAA